ncbi:MAG: efflux RND transporter periplasmic adaptor subunit [Bacteroidetes bacterium]|nr:efflux RND transporter periplasmic adaptor subunit [Bacteroidota bacterium]
MKKIFIILFGLAITTGCATKKNNTDQQEDHMHENTMQLTDAQLQNFSHTTTRIKEATITQTLKLNGKIDVPPQNLVSVSVALGGYLKSTRMLPGSHFNKGEVIAVMEDNQYIQLQQDYLSVKAQLQNAEAEYIRQKELNQSKAGSDKAFQQAKAAFEILQINKAALEQKLSLININYEKLSINNISRTISITAPFDGYVTQVLVNVGKYVSPSDVLFELVDPRDLHLDLKVFEKDIDKIKIGDSLIAFTNSNPQKKHKGKLLLIGKNISNDRAVEVHAHFIQYDPALIPGMYMNAEIEVHGTKMLALPDECIVSFEGKNYVFKAMSKNTFEMIEVKTGSSGNGFTEIQNATELEGIDIVQQGAYTLLMGMKNKGEDHH